MNKVLVVDDDPVNRMVLEELLDDEPYELETAESGEEALESCARFQPDLVLLDIMMPGIDGFETCAQLRRDESQRYTKIVFVSAKAMVSSKRQGYESGGDDYISKPFDHAELLARIELLLRLKSVQQTESLKTEFLEWLNQELRTEVLDGGGPLAESGPINNLETGEFLAKCRNYLDRLECLEKICNLKTGCGELAMASVDLVKLTRSAIDELRDEAQKKGIEIQLSAPDSVTAHADAEKPDYVVKALLKNAIRFGPQNVPVVVEIRQEDGFVILSVTDRGEGVDAKSLPSIFDEFSHENWQNGDRGAGLSLALGRAMIERHGGTLEAQSVAGSGTCFTVRLKSS